VLTELSRSASYTVVRLIATPTAVKRIRPDLNNVRPGRVALTVVLGAGLIAAATRLGPFLPAGADLTDPTQRIYATNIWQESQTSLALLAVFLPWLVYGLLFQGAAWGRRLLILIAVGGTLAGTWLTLLSLQSYAALPRSVTGMVGQIEGRRLSLAGGGGVYLVTSDAELASAARWLKPGARVTMWVSPRGQAGYVGPAESLN
jgi:hypothetical protein